MLKRKGGCVVAPLLTNSKFEKYRKERVEKGHFLTHLYYAVGSSCVFETRGNHRPFFDRPCPIPPGGQILFPIE